MHAPLMNLQKIDLQKNEKIVAYQVFKFCFKKNTLTENFTTFLIQYKTHIEELLKQPF